MSRRCSHRGFSFIELLFAVAVMAIGIIGVAGALYVGIDQTKTTLDETTAAAIARQAAATLGQVMNSVNAVQTSSFFAAINTQGVPTGSTVPPLPSIVQPAQIATADQRFAWIPLYRRTSDTTPTADVLIVVVRAAARSDFGPADIAAVAPPYLPGLVPVLIKAQMQTDPLTNDTDLVVTDPGTAGAGGAITSGALIVLNPGPASADLAGRVVRLAERVTANTWSLAPGQDLAGVPLAALNMDAFAVGRGFADPAHPENGYTGDNQAVAAYATTILLR